jgi:hypothetical protein
MQTWFCSMPASPPAQALLEAAFSLTPTGHLDSQEALRTVRGQTAAAFKANLTAVRGLLETPARPAPTTPQCLTHGAMQPSTKGKGWYCPHKLEDDAWCKGKEARGAPRSPLSWRTALALSRV